MLTKPNLILAHFVRFHIIASQLRFAKRHLIRLGRPAVIAGLMVMVLLQMAMAASEPLHKLVHADADKAGHECSVTLFSHGQIEAASVEVPLPVPVTGIDLTPPALVSFYCPTLSQLPPGRGPPFSA